MRKVTLISYVLPAEEIGLEHGFITNVIGGWNGGPKGAQSWKFGFYTRANLKHDVIADILLRKKRLAFDKHLSGPSKEKAKNPFEKSPWNPNKVITAAWLEDVPDSFWIAEPEVIE